MSHSRVESKTAVKNSNLTAVSFVKNCIENGKKQKLDCHAYNKKHQCFPRIYGRVFHFLRDRESGIFIVRQLMKAAAIEPQPQSISKEPLRLSLVMFSTDNSSRTFSMVVHGTPIWAVHMKGHTQVQEAFVLVCYAWRCSVDSVVDNKK